MDKELVKALRAYCVELKEGEEEANRLQKERPQHEAYFLGLELGRMTTRIKIETLLENRITSTPFSCPSRGSVIDSEGEVID